MTKREIPPQLTKREVKYSELELFVEESLVKIYKRQKS
jgi:hypothetical protein